jgi:hypothetical protein
MQKRTPKEWRRLVAEYERESESRRGFCEWHGVAASTLDYWRRRVRGDAGRRLLQVQMETGGPLAGGQVPAVVIIWPTGVCVELGAGVASVALLSALHGGLWRGRRMFALSAATKVYPAAGATDLRKGFEGLCAMVEGMLEEVECSPKTDP